MWKAFIAGTAIEQVPSVEPHTIQHLHCRLTTNQSTGSDHGLCRWHHHHIYTHKHECSQEIHNTDNQTYITFFSWTKHNNPTLNPDKTTCTLFTPDPAEYKSNLDLKINNTELPMVTHPQVLGLTLDPELTYSTHIHNILVDAHKPLQIIKTLTATGWRTQKQTLKSTYRAVMRPALEYASSYGSLLHPRPALTNCKSCRTYLW